LNFKQIFTVIPIAILALAITLIALTNIIIVSHLPIHPRPRLPELSTDSHHNLPPTLIVLGAGVRKKELSGMLRCRMVTAIELYKKTEPKRILLSGDGTNHHYNETSAMKKYALEKGIDSELLLTDPLGFSTYDSLRRAIEVFGIRSALIVSQSFHLQRALWIAESFGINASGESCDNDSSSLFYELREIPARTKDVFIRWLDLAPRSNRDEIF
jgi:SanA protein